MGKKKKRCSWKEKNKVCKAAECESLTKEKYCTSEAPRCKWKAKKKKCSTAYEVVRRASPLIVDPFNPCKGAKPKSMLPEGETHLKGQVTSNGGFDNFDCRYDGVVQAVEQSGANVTKGYNGDRPATQPPQLEPYWSQAMCPVNVHWHLGAEHYSIGEYDETGSGPTEIDTRRRLAGKRQGFQCTSYDETDKKFTTPYKWQHCTDMEV